MTLINKFKRKILIIYWTLLGTKNRIKKEIELSKHKNINNYKYVLGVYDYTAYKETFAIGDFLCFLFFYKCFIKYNKRIEMIIICDNQKKLNKFEKSILKAHIGMAKVFLGKYLYLIKVCKWSEFKKKKFREYYIPFIKEVYERKDFRFYFLSMYNDMLSSLGPNFLKKFLMNKKDFEKFESKIPNKYLTWHIRHNPEWSQLRNIKKNEFLEIYRILRKKIGSIPIMIISDEKGCSFAKRIAKDEKLKLSFCKDVSKSLFSDFFLIINSNLFFCFKAGGVLVLPWFSKINYIWGGTIGLKNQFISGWSISINKLHFWQTDNQIWVNSNNFHYFKYEIENINFKRFGF